VRVPQAPRRLAELRCDNL